MDLGNKIDKKIKKDEEIKRLDKKILFLKGILKLTSKELREVVEGYEYLIREYNQGHSTNDRKK